MKIKSLILTTVILVAVFFVSCKQEKPKEQVESSKPLIETKISDKEVEKAYKTMETEAKSLEEDLKVLDEELNKNQVKK